MIPPPSPLHHNHQLKSYESWPWDITIRSSAQSSPSFHLNHSCVVTSHLAPSLQASILQTYHFTPGLQLSLSFAWRAGEALACQSRTSGFWTHCVVSEMLHENPLNHFLLQSELTPHPVLKEPLCEPIPVSAFPTGHRLCQTTPNMLLWTSVPRKPAFSKKWFPTSLLFSSLFFFFLISKLCLP